MVQPEQITIIGCGDIGKQLAREVDDTRYRLSGIRRSPQEPDAKIHYQAADFTDASQLDRALPAHSDVVVMTLTPSTFSDSGYLTAYVHGSEAVVEVLKKRPNPPRLLLFVSSTSVYGQSHGEWIDERSPCEPNSFQGTRMLEAEAVISNSGLTYSILRCSGVYGPGRLRTLRRIEAGRFVGDMEKYAYTNRIHSRDCARALLHLIERQRQGHSVQSLYLASDHAPTQNIELEQWLADRMAIAIGNDVNTNPNDEQISGKRCDNRRLLSTQFEFLYPSYREGYAELLASAHCGMNERL